MAAYWLGAQSLLWMRLVVKATRDWQGQGKRKRGHVGSSLYTLGVFFIRGPGPWLVELIKEMIHATRPLVFPLPLPRVCVFFPSTPRASSHPANRQVYRDV